mgnify:CR=1 FL=1
MKSRLGTALRAAVMLLPLPMMIVASSVHGFGQQVWPGDINNNGIVNGVDLLYHGVAEGVVGPQRTETGTDWSAYDTAPAWTGSYIDGLNYNRADVNGKGKVEQRDRRALWQDNYGLEHGAVLPDVFLAGDATVDPVLDVTATVSQVQAGQAIMLDISLGDAQKQVQDFFGITFTLKFNPEHIEDELDEPLWNPEKVKFDLLNNSWLNPTGNEVEAFVQLDNTAGELEVVILRKNVGPTSGHGEIASVMTITEDIIFLEDVNTSFSIDEVKLVDDNLVEYPVAGSVTTVTIQAPSLSGLQASSTQSQEEETGSSEDLRSTDINSETPSHQPIKNNSFNEQHTSTGTITVYPNPVVDRLQARVDSAEEEIVELRLFSAGGQLVRTLPNVQAPQAEMDVSNLPGGNYVLQLETTSGTTVKMISK